jgi:hypothetical protein
VQRAAQRAAIVTISAAWLRRRVQKGRDAEVDKAAAVVAAVWRGRKQRREVAVLTAAATVVSAHWRGISQARGYQRKKAAVLCLQVRACSRRAVTEKVVNPYLFSKCFQKQ